MHPFKIRNFHGNTVNKVSQYYMQLILAKYWHGNLELLLNARHWKESGELNFIQR